MGTQGTGRKRSTKKERSTAEDDALNLIAREVSGTVLHSVHLCEEFASSSTSL